MISNLEKARLVLKALHAGGAQARFAGGCVRDRLMGLAPVDFDIATTAKPDAIIKIAHDHHWKAIPTGIDHGTVTVVTPDGSYEVTTLRRDVKTDGRHAVVDFEGATFQDDAARRDFTINAMFEDIDGKIYDFHGGQQDIEQKIIRFVGDAKTRILEDHLRILRFFRFWSRCEFSADESGLFAINELHEGLKTVSRERISKEFWGILSGGSAAEALSAMQSTGTLHWVLESVPPLDHSLKIMIRDASQSFQEEFRPWLIMMLLLGIPMERQLSPESIHQLAISLRWSEREQRILTTLNDGWNNLARRERDRSDAMEFVDDMEKWTSAHHYRFSDFFAPLLSFCAQHAHDEHRRERLEWVCTMEAAYSAFRKQEMPISGNDIIAACPHLVGPAIGKALTELKKDFRNGLWKERPEGLARLKHIS